MALTPGTKLGPYEIIAPLGAGGMGEVYRAKDTRLGREVAIKVLPQHLSDNADIRTRFEREARTISSLNHPNICTLFDVGREGDMDYLVMELIVGETLADRLRKGPLGTPEMLRIGTQIADALDRAHRAGVTHRDLKPGNIMLTKSGAKLMDFGLARASSTGGPVSGSGATMTALTHSPTVASPLTADGAIVGTFQYMSPEQLEGREADARSDIWALGCVIYEMTTGRRAFEGRSQASLIAAILERPAPSVGETPSGASTASGAPAGLDRLIRNCLAKDPDDRVQTAHDVKLQLQGIQEGAGLTSTNVSGITPGPVTSAAPRHASSPVPWLVAALATMVALAAVAWTMLRSEPVRPVARFRIDAPAGAVWFGWPRIAPDGSRILFQAVDTTGTMRAYVRPTDQLDGVAIPGSEGLTRAYWSPDGKEVIFVQNGNLMSASLAGGSPRLICAAKGGTDLSWGSKGTILMDGQYVDSLRAVPSTGGEPKYATRVDHAKGEVGTAWPSFLPDGEHFLFIGNMPQGMVHNHMRLGKLGSLESKYLGDADGRVEYAPGDWVIFSRSTSLFAQKLDVGAGKLTGEPITLTDQLSIGGGQGEFSVSPQGSIVFKRLQSNDAQTIAIMDRSGHVQQNPSLMATFYNPQISPDGKRLLYQRLTSGGNASEIDVFDLVRSTDTKLTFTNGTAVTPQWSPDGRRFAFITRTADGTMKLRTGASDGLGAMDSMTLPPRSRAVLTQWAAAGSRFIVTVSGGILSATAGDTAHALTALGDSTKGFLGQVSPDGRWLVFVSGNPPSSHVYVRSLIGPPGRWQISSTVQGYKPHWTRGGRELIYEDWNGVLQSVTIDTQEGFRAGTPQRLFKLPLPSGNDDQVTWTVDDAGEHFYVIQAGDGNHLGSVEVITDIGALLKRK